MRSLNCSLILLCISLCTCTKQPYAAPQATPTPQQSQGGIAELAEPLRTLGSELTIVEKTRQLPTSCKAAFVALTKMPKFEMAEPGESFQVGDVVVFHQPWRRLVLGGFNAERCFIHYEKGGRGHSNYTVLFGVSRDGKATFLWGGAGWGTSPSLEKLRSDIADGKFRTIGESDTGW